MIVSNQLLVCVFCSDWLGETWCYLLSASRARILLARRLQTVICNTHEHVASSMKIFRSVNENEDENEFSCLVMMRMHSCPYVTVMKVGNFSSAAS